MLGYGEGGLNLFLTNQGDARLHLAFRGVYVRLWGPDEKVYRATCDPRASVCPPLI